MEKRVPLGPFSPLSQSLTTKVFSTLPLVAFSSKLSVAGGVGEHRGTVIEVLHLDVHCHLTYGGKGDLEGTITLHLRSSSQLQLSSRAVTLETASEVISIVEIHYTVA